MPRLTLQDSPYDYVTKMAMDNCGVNIGAVIVLTRVLSMNRSIDPKCIEPAMYLVWLDEWGIYGSRIWMLYKDLCDGSLEKFVFLIRAAQLGVIAPESLKNMTVDVDDCVDRTRKELGYVPHNR